MHSKKHLKFRALIESVKKEFNKIEDNRGKNKSNSISDVMLSGIACMYFQCPSLLDFQRRMAAIRDMRNREVENFDNSTQKQI
jgi:hypothetical protein